MFVADASVAGKWLFPDEVRSDLAFRLLDDELAGDRRILAPPLLRGELTNVLRKRMRRESLQLETALALLDQFLDLPITILSPPRIEHDALRLAEEFGLPATYDAHYVSLARRTGCEFWTDDQRLIRALAGRLPFVRWIGGYGR
jgi:predicted nucleic acid-binding protein